MESSLEVLSRAVSMIKDSEVEKLSATAKEKQTSLESNRHHHYLKQRAAAAMNEVPLDMTISKHRRTPPPPYPYPDRPIELTKPTTARPSVITKAPRIINHMDDGPTGSSNGGSENILPQQNQLAGTYESHSDSISMCETVIDEHFRRSLGNNYVALLTNEKANKLMKVEIPSPTPSTTSTASNGQAALSPAAITPPVRSAPHTPIPSSSPAPTFMPLAPVAATILPAEVAIPDADNFVTVQASTPPVAALPIEPNRPASSTSNADIDVDVEVEDENSDGENDENGISVDDHFAKALGNDMWKKIQEKSLKS